MKKLNSVLLMLSLGLSGGSFAADAAAVDEGTKVKYGPDQIKEVEQKVQANFSNLKVTAYQASPIEGIYELHAGPNILYFHADSELMIIGEIYNRDGESLTQLSKQKRAMSKIEDLPMDSAVSMGDPDGIEIIEFGQPECGYCKLSNREIAKLAKKYPIKRTYFFVRVGGSFPNSQAKVEHILCSEDKEEAYKNIDSVAASDFKQCDEGKLIFEKHDEVVNTFGVNGTPSFLLNGVLVEGANMKKVEEYLKEQMKLRSQE